MKSATDRPQRGSGSKLSRTEWDFSKVPADQLEACFAWEYAREWEILRHGSMSDLVPSETKTVNAGDTRKGEFEPDEIPNPDFEQYELDPDEWVGCRRAGVLVEHIHKLDTPWQELPKEIRARFLQHGTPETIGLLELDPKSFEFQVGFQIGERTQEKPWFKAAAFRVNWDQSDKRLLSDFASWLRDNRDRPAKERRGRNRRDDLNMLGAMRLLNRMRLEDAIIETTRALGEPLYGKRPSWERARKTALRVFQEDFLIDAARWQEKQFPLSFPKVGGD